MRKILFLVKI